MTDAGPADAAGPQACYDLQQLVPEHCIVISVEQAQRCYACEHPVEPAGLSGGELGLALVFLAGMLVALFARRICE